MTGLITDPGTLATDLYKAPFLLHHGLVHHPLFHLDQLVVLAQTMPGDKIEYNSGNLDPNTRPEDVPTLDLPVAEVIRRIENHNAWLVIKRVERMPEYRALLEAILSELHGPSAFGDISDIQGFIFVSSAHATTPFHFDAEENVLLQIHGDKFVHIFDNTDHSLVTEEALELSPSKHRNQTYLPEFEKRGQLFTLKPGDGVHIPYTWPHWVRTGSSYSISIAVTWKTKEVIHLNKIRLINGTLREYGFPQSPPHTHPLWDTLKATFHDIVFALLSPLRRSERLRRFLRGMVYGREANYFYREDKKE